jgi:hypothetical protein
MTYEMVMIITAIAVTAVAIGLNVKLYVDTQRHKK